MDRLGRVDENFQGPCQDDDAENKNVVPLHATANGLKAADFERGENQILTNKPAPLAIEDFRTLRHHGNEEMGFQHAHPAAKGIVKPIAPCFDP